MSDNIFTRTMACQKAKEAWDKLKDEFQRGSRTRQMQVLNLRREFEGLKMNDADIVEEFFHKIIKVLNQICLVREEL